MAAPSVALFVTAALSLAGAMETPVATMAQTARAADCTRVDAVAVGEILGLPVGNADPHSREASICFFTASALTENGSASYAILDEADVERRRPYYAVLARRCSGVAASAPRAALCATYARLGDARDLAAYYAARTAAAEPVEPPLGDASASADDVVYVKRADRVFEIAVRRNGVFDLDRSVRLARVVLERTQP